MSNKIVYTCDSSGEGSDMDVSDTEAPVVATTQTLSPEQQLTQHAPPRPHQGIVTSLHRYMQRDSWGDNAIKPHAEKKGKHVVTTPNPNSYASVASRNTEYIPPALARKHSIDPDANNYTVLSDDDDDMSCDSFHTAPNSPDISNDRTEEDFEPGEIDDVSVEKELQLTETAIRARLQSLQANANEIKETLKQIRAKRDQITIRRLEYNVRNSIAMKRNPSRYNGTASPSTPGLSPLPSATVSAPSTPPPPPPPSSEATASSSKADSSASKKTDSSTSSKAAMRTEALKRKEYMKEERTIQSQQKTTAKRTLDEAEQRDDTPPKTKKAKKAKVDDTLDYNDIVDPINIKEIIDEHADIENPPYTAIIRSSIKERIKAVRAIIHTYSLQHTPSLKAMRLILMNFKIASLRGPLTLEQEEYLKHILKAFANLVQVRLTVTEKRFKQAVNQEIHPPTLLLPNEFFGDFDTLDFNAPDISHKEIFQCYTHFAILINDPLVRKACRMLILHAGSSLQSNRLHWVDPGYLRESSPTPLSKTRRAKNAKIIDPFEETLNKRKELMKLRKQLSKMDEKTEKNAQKDVFRKENERLSMEIEHMAQMIATNMTTRSKTAAANAAANPTQSNTPPPSKKGASTTSNQSKGTPTQPKSQHIRFENNTKPPQDKRPLIKAVETKSKPGVKSDHQNVQIYDSETSTTTAVSNDNTKSTNAEASSSTYYKPYTSALNTLGFSETVTDVRSQTKKGTLCRAESAGGVCRVRDCPYTHFKDFQ